MILSVRDKTPTIGEGTYLSPSSQLIGDVHLGRDCSVWFNTVIRGDVMPIEIGDESNVQDGCVLHGTFNRCGVKIGRRVSVGHSVILHGCEIGDESFIGMGSVVMDLVKIPERCLVGAGSLVTEKSEFESGHLILGRPAKMVRKLTDEELAFLSKSADNYLQYKSWYQS